MGNQLAVEENAEDWLHSDSSTKGDARCYPRKFKQYIHFWKCESEQQDFEIIKTSAVTITDDNFLFNSKDSYIIMHVRYPLTAVINERKDCEAKDSKDWNKLFESLSTINPATTKDPLISKHDNKFKSVSSPYYEIHVWNGSESSSINSVCCFIMNPLFMMTLISWKKSYFLNLVGCYCQSAFIRPDSYESYQHWGHATNLHHQRISPDLL